ncbi:MAG: hypothetical protein AB7S26_03235 [Sandaracinaceae bacterium]
MRNARRIALVGAALGALLSACDGDGEGPSDAAGRDAASPNRDGGVTPDRDAGPGVVVLPSSGGTRIVDPATALPAAPAFAAVRAWTDGDTLRAIPFAVDGARDYRVYRLPDDASIADLGGGAFAIEDGTFRCAGQRYAPELRADVASVNFDEGQTIVVGDVQGFARSEADARLGYVALAEEDGLVPLYGLGSPFVEDDNTCYEAHNERFFETRHKRYLTDEARRDALLAAGWRDEGVVGYVPTSGAQVYEAGDNLYVVDGAERAMRSDAAPAFFVFADDGPGRQPLLRVHYGYIPCASGDHDVLTVGTVAFERARHQGIQPLNRVSWAGARVGDVYVVEALDAVCPYQGMIVDDSHPSGDAVGTSEGVTRHTEAQIRAAEAHGQLFINAQGAADATPGVLARAFVEIVEVDDSIDDLAWSARFHDASLFDGLSQITDEYLIQEYGNDQVMLSFLIMDWYSFGITHDELWVGFDEANGSNGKFRMTPRQTVDLSDASFVHATMSVDSLSSNRRYPQLWVTDHRVDLPIQTLNDTDHLESGGGILLQPFLTWPYELQVELCERRTWDVNNQCPLFALDQVTVSGEDRFLPHAEWSEELHLGWRVRYDFYVSTRRAYVFVDRQPYACVEIPDGALEAGDGAHVTFGSVLYHSGALPDVSSAGFYSFHDANMVHGTRRMFDDLGFEDGSGAPMWDESIRPCVSQIE